MPANESSLRFYFMRRLKIKVVYQKCIFQKYWKKLLVESKKNTFNYVLNTNRISTHWRFIEKSRWWSYQLQLKAHYIWLHPKLNINISILETLTASKGKCSILVYLPFQLHNIIVQLLLACLKKGLHLLHVSEMFIH